MERLPTLGPHGEGWVLLQALLGGMALVAGLAGLTAPNWDGAARIATTVAGVPLVVVGAYQAWRGIRDLGANVSPLPHPTADCVLVEEGIYARVRHPIYGGVILASLGWGLVTTSPVALAIALLLLPFFVLKSSVEERWLEARFPAYPAYRRRTRRFFALPL